MIHNAVLNSACLPELAAARMPESSLPAPETQVRGVCDSVYSRGTPNISMNSWFEMHQRFVWKMISPIVGFFKLASSRRPETPPDRFHRSSQGLIFLSPSCLQQML
jgi:hypothetical protein